MAIGVELDGHGDEFQEAQVQAACRLWRAMVRAVVVSYQQAMMAHTDR